MTWKRRRRPGSVAAWLAVALLPSHTAAAQPPTTEPPLHEDRQRDRAPFLNGYVGRYQLSEQFFLDITRVGDALYVQTTGQEAQQLTPRSQVEFVIIGSSLRLVFEENPVTGEVVRVVFEQGGFGRRAEKLAAADVPTPPRLIELGEDVLRRYVGTYEEQPGFAIDVRLERGQLVAGFTNQDGEPINATSETQFVYAITNATLTFELADDGRPLGLVLHQGGTDIEMTRRDD